MSLSGLAACLSLKLIYHFNPFPQDIPFLILAGTYTQSSSSFNVPVFFAILASLLGILTYLLYLLRERNNIQAYLSWLRGQLEKLPCADRVRGKEGVSPEVQGPAHVPPAQLRSYGNSESEHSDDSGVSGRGRGSEERISCAV